MNRIIHIQRIDTPPDLRGDLSQQVWEKAKWNGGFSVLAQPDQKAEHPTAFAMVHDGENPKWLSVSEDNVYDRLEKFEKDALAAGLKPVQYAIRWLLNQPGITSVVVGVKRIEQLDELCAGNPS
ncbi:MAG: hypothetical protein EXS18_07395 [Verrucomicrobiae bacterium]|nr:hypothetical protein [Verrucomicrobiae bacterium]